MPVRKRFTVHELRATCVLSVYGEVCVCAVRACGIGVHWYRNANECAHVECAHVRRYARVQILVCTSMQENIQHLR